MQKQQVMWNSYVFYSLYLLYQMLALSNGLINL